MAAPICTNCPDFETLQHVLDCSLSDDAQSRVVAHLDACESCQQKIESIATGGDRLMECAAHVGRGGPDNKSAYWPALRELERQVVKVAHAPLNATVGEGDDGVLTLDDISLDFLDHPEQPGTLGEFGRFHVVEVVGRGGMGIVLRALDACLQRQVALKVLDPKFARNDLARNRFIREARAAASIAHENVVAVHSVEKHRSEVPYLVMRLVTGESLQERLDKQEGPLAVREILRIGLQIAAGLAAAHEQELIHRDIKPANILLEAGTNRVMLTDFGLARAVEDARLTQTGLVAGTPLYMSPEQARGETLDHRSDLFSFGSVLYAMCTGAPPFQGSSPFVVLREVTEGNQRPIHEINANVPDELAAIIDQLLAKKPDDRIQSAAEVAGLLQQMLAKMPAHLADAVPVRRTARTLPRFSRSWWGRHGGWIGLIIIGANLLLLGSELAGLTHWSLIGQRDRDASANEVAGPVPLSNLNAGIGPIWSVAFAPDGNNLAMAVNDGSVRLWNTHSSTQLSTIKAHKGMVWSVAYSPDGSTIASAGDDGWVRLWNAQTSNDGDRRNLGQPVQVVAFSPDGSHLATGTRTGAVRILDAGSSLKTVIATSGHEVAVLSLAFSPDGKFLASADAEGTVKVWDVSNSDGKEVTSFNDHVGSSVFSVAFHPTKKIVATGSWDRTIRLRDIEKNQQLGKFEGHREDVRSVAFVPDGVHLVSGSEDRTAKLWDINTGKEVMTFKGHASTIYSVAVSKDGKRLATASRDGTAKLWELP